MDEEEEEEVKVDEREAGIYAERLRCVVMFFLCCVCVCLCVHVCVWREKEKEKACCGNVMNAEQKLMKGTEEWKEEE